MTTARIGVAFLMVAGRAVHSLAAQAGTSGMPELHAAIAATTASILAQCPDAAPGDRGALLRDELRASNTVQREATADNWYALGCLRASLYTTDAHSREGLLMPPGMSWHEGAALVLLEGLEVDPGHAASATLLAELGLAEIVGPPPDRIAAALIRARDAGVRNATALRGCSEFARRQLLLEEAMRCGSAALERGVDSTWQLLHVSRLAFSAGDTATGQRLFHRATLSAHDSASWAELGWHLRWFMEPGEAAEWRMIVDSARPAFVRDRFASRDVRDGRAPGSRMAEHFARLDSIEQLFAVHVQRRDMGRFEHAADPESTRYPEYVAMWWEPGLAAAPYFRDYKRWEPRFDDRAAIFMRFGSPDKRITWAGRDTVGTPAKRRVPEGGGLPIGIVAAPLPTDPDRLGPPGKPPLIPITNAREVWSYQVDGQQLLLSFESEDFDASNQATRLVSGVLGSYMCDVNTYRCNLTSRSQMAFNLYYELGTATPNPLPPETLAAVQAADREYIREATTKDDNSVRVEHPVATVAQFSRVWDPRSGATLAVIPYAFKVGDLERSEDSTGISATIALTLRQWDAGAASWQSTDVIRRLRLPDRLRNNSHLTGYLVTPTTAGTSAWSLVATQGADRRGRAWGDRLVPLTRGNLAMSDLVIGAASQGQTWTTTGGTQVPLGPLGAFDKDAPISLYWQVRSSAARDPVRIAVAIFRVGARDTERPVLEVGFDGRVSAGLSEWQRDIGVAQLDGGTYRVEVTVRDGEASAVRSARLLLR